MTQEKKSLLLQDLCARLLYGIKICYTEFEYGCKSVWDVDYIYPDGNIVCKHPYAIHNIENCQLYLRSMSSMTEEERLELSMLSDNDSVKFYLQGKDVKLCFMSGDCFKFYKVFDWLNAHHFDYRGLIPIGLALEALEGMYKK